MKKRSSVKGDEMRAEYDFSSIRGGVRGKYSRRYRAGVNLVLLDPEIARAFPTDVAVNEALRTVLRVATTHRRATTLPNERMQRTSGASHSRRAARR
jgi:hypothetical protein